VAAVGANGVPQIPDAGSGTVAFSSRTDATCRLVGMTQLVRCTNAAKPIDRIWRRAELLGSAAIRSGNWRNFRRAGETAACLLVRLRPELANLFQWPSLGALAVVGAGLSALDVAGLAECSLVTLTDAASVMGSTTARSTNRREAGR
jgi:hypothetical protein